MKSELRALMVAGTVVILTACGQDERKPAPLNGPDQSGNTQEKPLVSPDTRGAVWTVSDNGRAIDFGQPGGANMLTLECRLRDEPVRMAIVRHAPARPGQTALLPVIGNGEVSRFKVDATLAAGEWRWEAELPASDPQLDVFAGPLELEATLPGGGTLKIAGSSIPGQFVAWCRAGGKAPPAEAASSAPPSR